MKHKSLGWLALGLAILLVIITGCNGGGNTKTDNKGSNTTVETPTAASDNNVSKSSEPIEIKWWIYPNGLTLENSVTGEPDEWAKEYAARFKEIHPEADIKIELLDWASGTEKVDVSVAAGSPPDMVYSLNSFGGVSKYGKMGALEPIDDYLTQADWDDFPEAVKGAMIYDGKAYLWPQLALVSALAINMDLFEERNAVDLLPLDRPLRDWTYEEFLEAAKAVTFSRSGNNSNPDVYGTGSWGKDGAFYQFLYGVSSGGQILNDNFSEVTINSPEFNNGLQFMADLSNVHKVTPTGAAGLTSQNIMDMFLNQQIAMINGYGDLVQSAANAPKPFKVEFVAPPHAEGQETKAWNNVAGFLVFKQNDDKKKELVMEFAKFVTNTENSKILKSIGVFPARQSTGNLYGDDPVMSYFNELSKYGDSNFSRSFGLATTTEWEAELQAILTGGKTVEASLQSLESLIKSRLTE